ncbi:polysaccharide biosynthesis C-terminal domain-containing protein [Telluria mixta]|uniref:Polysaccharide biosynthesis C-terminal domain-containing protein n=1 Tax=Telluria mixta TaxID=34071 RepID=A0ABT2BRJ0_9BURK|nr:polysaccharide biosynthesis C-terminal domain-containing protein [Telluria mixta]MCS0627735.1 polysaccharide biosynthesis C-terminal domain-containing protein [Telluria mixta]WEM94143.1 polysaccharide biosynthesis C-terminal domain-containing protein [Telluria mixta]
MRIVILLIGTAGNALIAFLTHLLLTRNLAVDDYGRVVAITAAVTMVTPVASMCIGWFWLELYGREGEAAVRWGPGSRMASLGAFSISSAVLVGYGMLAGIASPVVLACACMMLAGQSLAETRAVRLQLEERYNALGVWQAAPQALRSAAVLAMLVVSSGLSDQTAMMAYGFAALVVAALSSGSIQAVTDGGVRIPGAGRARRRDDATGEPAVSACFKAAWPFSLVTLFYLVYSTGILALLNPLIGAAASAYYNIGFLLFNSLAMLPSVIYGKFLVGKLFRWWSHDREKFVAVFHLGVAAHFGLGIVLGALMWWTAPVVVPLLFGEHYRDAVPVVRILALAVPIRFVQHGYGAVLFSKEHIRRKVRYMGQAALLSVVLLVVLAGRYGVTGAAVTSVASELALLVFYMAGAARHVAPIDVRATFLPRTLTTAYRRLVGEG